jgi:hypothetical protein
MIIGEISNMAIRLKDVTNSGKQSNSIRKQAQPLADEIRGQPKTSFISSENNTNLHI